MRKLVVAGTAAMLLSACGSGESGTVQTEDGEVSYESSESDGQTSMQITGPDGEEVNISSGQGGEADMPAGFELYPGARVVSNTKINQGPAQGTMVMMQSSDAPAELVKFYREQAENAGIEIEMELKTGDGQMISGKDQTGTAFSFNANPAGEGTNGQLIVGSGMGS
ncbi:hypothetical protein FHS61_003067 [Altererythrobacter atlanticus]|uniref:Uncharacterized protein n=1 Tax=Croceibacterium atlanticum TaxID=1267766 RepID=A0A0F7KSC2_9SPHN|nr:hypothetical protein [Croceibacterium atlanticum]AKH42167.1 hypothetical protein WYH_01120 [Croceibacterium atlanticum]MBB5734020.1 hypothetical protein [Croceibacterium atlanticum]